MTEHIPRCILIIAGDENLKSKKVKIFAATLMGLGIITIAEACIEWKDVSQIAVRLSSSGRSVAQITLKKYVAPMVRETRIISIPQVFDQSTAGISLLVENNNSGQYTQIEGWPFGEVVERPVAYKVESMPTLISLLRININLWQQRGGGRITIEYGTPPENLSQYWAALDAERKGAKTAS
ncbi:MAG: hypothetical protein LBJ92_03160 [Holosporales bacterium]|nr:hypothetical protein [Holosporales bacterium]